jgi:phosphatidylserine decarboxylase
LDAYFTPPYSFLRAKYQPYDALRQRFWRQYLNQYDTDETGTLSFLELSSMLDSLGSTLSTETIESYFARYGKKANEDELTIPEAIRCLENELCRPTSERKTVDGTAEDSSFAPNASSGTTPTFMEEEPKSLRFDSLDFAGPPNKTTDYLGISLSGILDGPRLFSTEPMESALLDVADIPPEISPPMSSTASSTGGNQRQMTADSQVTSSQFSQGRMVRQHSGSSSDVEDSPNHGADSEDPVVERVINIKNCPLCHRPRLTKKAERDIVTHLAVCASQDWNKVDRIMVSNFVTASQAQRKWYTKVIAKVSSGNYKLGAVCLVRSSARIFST